MYKDTENPVHDAENVSESKEKGLMSSPVVVEEIGDDTESSGAIRLAVESADVEEGTHYALSEKERKE